MRSNGDIIKYHQHLLQLLHVCSKAPSLKSTRPLHGLTITMGPVPNQAIFVYNNIMFQYTSLGMLLVARNVFDKMSQRNVVSFNTMICAYGRCGLIKEAWDLFSEMRGCGFEPTQFTFGGLLSAASLNLWEAAQLQALTVKNGLFDAGAFVGTALLGLYGRHGCLEEALRTFEDIPTKSLVTWNAILSLFGCHELVEDCKFLFRELMCGGMALSKFSFVGILSCLSCEEDLKFGQQTHGIVIKIGFYYEVSVVNCLVNMYLKCGGFLLAGKLFDEVPVRDVMTWNSIIGAGKLIKKHEIAIELFYRMSASGVIPTQASFVNAVNSCRSLECSIYGEYFHSKIIHYAFESDVVVGTALIDFYAKFNKMKEAHCCFDEIAEKNLVSWNALILGYSTDCYSTSMYLLIEMLHCGFEPNEFTFSAILRTLSASELHQVHCLIISMGYEENEYVSSSLASSYAKHGLICDALAYVVSDSNNRPSVVPSNIVAGYYNRAGQYNETLKLLYLLEDPDIVSWNIVIAAYAKTNNHSKVLDLFKSMLMLQIYPDNYTFISLLIVCAKLCNLALGSSVHGVNIKTGFSGCDTFVCNLLIYMYGKCGSIDCALKVFDMVKDRNIITWTVLISVLGLNGYAYEALESFAEMELSGFKPDEVAIGAVLTACKHGGVVKEGMELFGKMKVKYGVEPKMDHYQCVVDLLARHGHLVEAEKVIAAMPFPPDALLWRSFLEGCKRQDFTKPLGDAHMNLVCNSSETDGTYVSGHALEIKEHFKMNFHSYRLRIK